MTAGTDRPRVAAGPPGQPGAPATSLSGPLSASLSGSLSAAVAELCTRLRPQVCAHTAAGLHEILRRLAAPLQVAVAGRLKSGKSTLVNALIGRRVAPTDVGECTRLVTRFQYGTVDRVEVVYADGRRRALPFDADGMIPRDLETDGAAVSHLEAYLTSAVLRDLTVIDTPGLGSMDATSVRRAERLLGTDGADGVDDLDVTSQNAIAGAEAVLYVLTQQVRADDEQVIASFTAATAGRDAGPANVIAVLNKVDTVAPESVEGSGGAVWPAARLLAERQSALLRPRVAAVLPVIGLLAETAETGAFTSADADALRELAALDDDTLATMALSADLFTAWDCPVPAATRARLLELLDLFGVDAAVAALRAEPELPAGALREALLASSGFGELRARLDDMFRARADGIKAAAALASVTALVRGCADAGERQRVRDAVERLLARPEAHQLRMLEALTLVSSGAVTLPDDLADEMLRVGGGGGVDVRLGRPGAPTAELVTVALERAHWWRSFASFGATPAQSRVSHAVHRAYFLIWQQLRSGGG